MQLTILAGELAVCRLGVEQEVPPWVWREREPLCSVTYTGDECSIVCPAGVIPNGVQAERGWRVLKVLGPLDFALTGVLVSLAQPLAEQGIPIFALSTFDTDYLLVKEQALSEAKTALEQAGHNFVSSP